MWAPFWAHTALHSMSSKKHGAPRCGEAIGESFASLVQMRDFRGSTINHLVRTYPGHRDGTIVARLD